MKNPTPILECVPNFSEGKDQKIIDAIADAIKTVKEVHLLHIDTSAAANRTVMTFAGAPEAVVEAAFNAIKTASELIDMNKQEGVHPRIGATDVCPLIPLCNVSMDEAVTYSKQLGKRVGEELAIPVYLYEHSAKLDYRRALPDIRKGQYEGMSEKMKNEEWKPDYGPLEFNANTGATVIGARDILVAFNIALKTRDVTIANRIAKKIRESGYIGIEDGKKVRINGLLPKLRAIGWYMQDYELAQVSFNLLNHHITAPLQVWQVCELLANEVKVELAGSEVIGLIPKECLIEAGQFAAMKEVRTTKHSDELLIHMAIELLGLNRLKPFDPQEKILEYALESKFKSEF